MTSSPDPRRTQALETPEQYFTRIWFYFYNPLDFYVKAKFMQEFPRGIDPVLEALRRLAPPDAPAAETPREPRTIAALMAAERKTRDMRTWGVDETAVDYNEPNVGNLWLIRHLADSLTRQPTRATVLNEVLDALEAYDGTGGEVAGWLAAIEVVRGLQEQPASLPAPRTGEPPHLTELPETVCGRCGLTVYYFDDDKVWATGTGEKRCDNKDQKHDAPECSGPFVDAWLCPVHDPRKRKSPSPGARERQALVERLEAFGKHCDHAIAQFKFDGMRVYVEYESLLEQKELARDAAAALRLPVGSQTPPAEDVRVVCVHCHNRTPWPADECMHCDAPFPESIQEEEVETSLENPGRVSATRIIDAVEAAPDEQQADVLTEALFPPKENR